MQETNRPKNWLEWDIVNLTHSSDVARRIINNCPIDAETKENLSNAQKDLMRIAKHLSIINENLTAEDIALYLDYKTITSKKLCGISAERMDAYSENPNLENLWMVKDWKKITNHLKQFDNLHTEYEILCVNSEDPHLFSETRMSKYEIDSASEHFAILGSYLLNAHKSEKIININNQINEFDREFAADNDNQMGE